MIAVPNYISPQEYLAIERQSQSRHEYRQGSSNLEEQKRVLEKILTVLSGHKILVLGDREFCSVSLGKWLQKQSVYFCLRQKQSTNVKKEFIKK